MGNVSLKVIEISLNFLLKKGYEPYAQFKGAGGVLPLLCELDSSLSQG